MELKRNVGPIDRVVRVVAAVALVGLAYAGIPAAATVYVTLAVALILAVTGFIGFCPLYALLGIRTVPARG